MRAGGSRGSAAFLLYVKQWRAIFGVALIVFGSFSVALFAVRRAEATPCSCNVFNTPTGQGDFDNGSPIELGVKIIPSVDGVINGVRFYKQGAMAGTHTGRLWTSGGTSLATAVFAGETASGWQEVTFSSPVSVTAGNTYVASVTMANNNYTATANYFTSDVVNGPLTAPSSAGSGGNGVFNTTGGSFPSSSFNDTNYWIDVSFYDASQPQVSSVTPTNGSTNVLPGETVTATFDQTMDSTTFSTSTVGVKDPSNNPVAGAVSYSSSTKTASFVATNGFAASTEYTVTIEGGTGTVVKNGAGVALAGDEVWSFTTSGTNLSPSTLKDRISPAGSVTADDSGGLELGVKVKPTTNGYITALRFYKPVITTETTHTGRIWSSTGSQLASVNFTNETDYGWQEARLSSPLQIAKNQVYIISYGTTTAVYQATIGGLNSSLGSGYLVAHADTSAENAATGSGNRNGVFTTTAGNYPASGSTNGSYYWIDAVFATSPSPTYPLSIGVTQPVANAYAAPRNQVATAIFNRPLDGATVTNSTFRLFDSGNNQVSGTASYSAAKGQAVFTPTSLLTYGAQYTAKLSASIADPAGTTLGTEYTWSFTVGSQLVNTPAQGPGGPLLVITSAANKYSPYYAEILRTEGFNYFDVKDITTVSASTLANYDAAILAEMTLSQSQADMLSTWVTAGGNLVAMRPDDKLAGLLGLADAGTTRANQYLLINTATTPGDGLVNETIQFKGTADNYTLNGATSIAAFYSDASTATSNPAVTSRSVGSNGGTAAAFSYDLAKSVIAQHQGNQAWAAQNRDGSAPIRTNDLFFGAMLGDVQPDWVDATKFHIPQADEQQRLLANLLIEAAKDKRPLPRFWYLPGDYKAAVVLVGDDHGLSNAVGTERILNNWLNESATNCSAADWACIRASHYTYDTSALTNARALQYHNLDFELGNHVGTTCNNFASLAALSAQYTSDLSVWRAKYSSIPNQVSHRYHCYVWSDWDSQALVEAANGMRYDLNYVAMPASWVGSKAPLMTGSGMNMRLTDADGDMLDLRQGVTNFDDQTSSSTNINALLDNATGASGYYGIFGSHYDMSNSYDATLLASAKSRNIPMISSKQVLTWLDGRESSVFSSFTGADGLFGFTIAAAEGANNLKAMLPIYDEAGQLSSLTLAGNAVTHDTRTIKGVQYAVFNALPGSYTAVYTDYDPNANSGSGGSSSSSTSSSKKKTTTTTTTEESSPTTTESTPVSEEQSETDEIPIPSFSQQEERKNDAAADWSWLLWMIMCLIVIIVVAFIIFFVRRRREQNSYTGLS